MYVRQSRLPGLGMRTRTSHCWTQNLCAKAGLPELAYSRKALNGLDLPEVQRSELTNGADLLPLRYEARGNSDGIR